MRRAPTPAVPAALTASFAADTERELAPYHRATVAADRSRLADIDAQLAGAPPRPPSALLRAMMVDADVFRGAVEIIACLALPEQVFARPGFADRVPGGRRHPGSPLTARQNTGKLRGL